MNIVIPVQGLDIEAHLSPKFSRAQYFLFVDKHTGQTRALPNPALPALEDAGIRAAQFVLANEAQAVLTVDIGLYAQQALHNAGITIYKAPLELANARRAVDHLRSGELQILSSSSEPA
jgi:predicted Fe-Mo cluster-binding NifX family protein